MTAGEATRVVVVGCADWPVAAAGVGPDRPAMVLHANRVVAASAAARVDGVAPGLRRRPAQARCPAAEVLGHDPARDARVFEPVVAALDALTPRVEVLAPGRCLFTARGPSRYFGGDRAVADRAEALITAALAHQRLATSVTAGVADGAFAAGLAAAEGRVVIPGGSAEFLSGRGIDELAGAVEGGAELVDVWRRLGLRTLGALAALHPADVLARFGAGGALAHRLASGLDARPPDTRPPPPEHTVTAELEPPAERVDTAAFVAKALADELHGRLDGNGLAATGIVIAAETPGGERLERIWRHEGTLTAGAVAERTRWQLDGWLAGRDPSHTGEEHGLCRLTLTAHQVVPARGRQLGFWGGEDRMEERVVRALARVQGLLGADAVTVPERRGGRGPADQVALVPAASVDLTAVRAAARVESVTAPWPGRVPSPLPGTVHPAPLVAEVVDPDGAPVGVTGRGVVTATPVRLSVGAQGPTDIVAWAGPWPTDERWWDPISRRRRARFQAVTAAGDAYLLAVEAGRWWVEATYD